MATDAAGLDVTLQDARARDAWDRLVTGALAHAATAPDALGAALARAPDFALGHAAMGFFQLLLGRRETTAAARAALARAQAGAAQTARERAYVAALAVALSQGAAAAAAALDAIADRWPGDALAVKLAHALRFVIGDAAGMRAAAERALPAFDEGHPHAGYVRGCLAFALEETGDYAAAERTGRAGLALAPDDAWGLHAVAHVYEMTAQADCGVRLLCGAAERWAHCNNFGAHVWWHLALFHLDRGAFEPALRLYDTRVRAAQTDDYRDIANAASLLARLEIEGVAVGARWEALADLAQARVADSGNVFADLHYLMALLGAGRDGAARRLVARLARDARGGAPDADVEAAAAGAPCAEGLMLLRRGAHGAAFARLRAAQASLRRIGGSNAQRDVFAWLTVAAAMRAGLHAEAAAALQARPGRRIGVDGYADRRLAALGASVA